MSKRVLFILGVVLLVIVGILLLPSFFGFNLTPTAFIYKVAGERQIQSQIRDARERKNNPPSSKDIKQMESDHGLCFHNDDCRIVSDRLIDCNTGSNNKYYCGKNKCLYTEIGCPSIYYSVCENNKCVKKSLDFGILKIN